MHGSLEHLKVEVDLCAPGWERIIDPSPPVAVLAKDIIFGEGPTWDAKNGCLWFTDIIGDTIWKWTPGKGQELVLRPSVKANGTCLDLDNRLVVAGWGGGVCGGGGVWPSMVVRTRSDTPSLRR